jgi:hypothetical protein
MTIYTAESRNEVSYVDKTELVKRMMKVAIRNAETGEPAYFVLGRWPDYGNGLSKRDGLQYKARLLETNTDSAIQSLTRL